MTRGRAAEALPRAIGLVGWSELVICFFLLISLLSIWLIHEPLSCMTPLPTLFPHLLMDLLAP